MPKNNTHPYIPGPGGLVKTFTQFRKAMPSKIDASTLKRLSLAPNNESMVLGVFRFLGFIDEKGNRTQKGKTVFVQHNDADFATALEKEIKTAYSALFELHGDGAWDCDRDTLIAFFRATDETSSITATRQTVAFETLAALSGHGEVSKPRKHTRTSEKSAKKDATQRAEAAGKITDIAPSSSKLPKQRDTSGIGDMALTVRIEINLPAQGNQETYDNIFKSIKANLLNA